MTRQTVAQAAVTRQACDPQVIRSSGDLVISAGTETEPGFARTIE
jgi:hypothetical protein